MEGETKQNNVILKIYHNPLSVENNKITENMYENIEKFDQKNLYEFNQIIRENKHFKCNIEKLIQKMEHFHQFTPDSLTHLIQVINKHPQTFYDSGPYIYIDGYWKMGNTSNEKLEI